MSMTQSRVVLRHGATPRPPRKRPPGVTPGVTVESSVSGPATAARAASRGLSPSATSRPAAMSTRVEATSHSPVPWVP